MGTEVGVDELCFSVSALTRMRAFVCRFRARWNWVVKATSYHKCKSAEEKSPLIVKNMIRLRGFYRSHHLITEEDIYNVDQVPIPLSVSSKTCWGQQGRCRMWTRTAKGVDDKRFCTLQLCIRMAGKQNVKPVVVFRGTHSVFLSLCVLRFINAHFLLRRCVRERTAHQ